jgi:hypothetical protein
MPPLDFLNIRIEREALNYDYMLRGAKGSSQLLTTKGALVDHVDLLLRKFRASVVESKLGRGNLPAHDNSIGHNIGGRAIWGNLSIVLREQRYIGGKPRVPIEFFDGSRGFLMMGKTYACGFAMRSRFVLFQLVIDHLSKRL